MLMILFHSQTTYFTDVSSISIVVKQDGWSAQFWQTETYFRQIESGNKFVFLSSSNQNKALWLNTTLQNL